MRVLYLAREGTGIPDSDGKGETASSSDRGLCCGVLDLAMGKYGCRQVQVYPAECGEQLGRDPPQNENSNSKSLILKSFLGRDLSLLVALTLRDTPVLYTPPLPVS